MTRIKDLHKKWMKEPEYRKEYGALEEEFARAIKVAKIDRSRDRSWGSKADAKQAGLKEQR
jgi:hypothetical protein